MASNYCPISLTSVCCKNLEHIICKHMPNHLENNKIVSPLQHGFCNGHSRESQLILTMRDIMQNFDSKQQTDLIMLDFSVTFDTVAHKKLLFKLNKCGIIGNVDKWIQSFLMRRKQQVIVIGPLFSLRHINDHPQRVTSKDDCLLYKSIHSPHDQLLLQQDLAALETLAEDWGMRFNVSKCACCMAVNWVQRSLCLILVCSMVQNWVQRSNHLIFVCSMAVNWVQRSIHLIFVCSMAVNWVQRSLCLIFVCSMAVNWVQRSIHLIFVCSMAVNWVQRSLCLIFV